MEIIKKVSAKQAWVKVSETEAVLLTFDKVKTNQEIIEEGVLINSKKKRLRDIQQQIKQLRNGSN